MLSMNAIEAQRVSDVITGWDLEIKNDPNCSVAYDNLGHIHWSKLS